MPHTHYHRCPLEMVQDDCQAVVEVAAAQTEKRDYLKVGIEAYVALLQARMQHQKPLYHR